MIFSIKLYSTELDPPYRKFLATVLMARYGLSSFLPSIQKGKGVLYLEVCWDLWVGYNKKEWGLIHGLYNGV